jgi:hypothetical protein
MAAVTEGEALVNADRPSMGSADVDLLKLKPNWRGRRALRSARELEHVVNDQVALLPRLPEDLRQRSADHTAELVMLGQAYRQYAEGWISRRELRRRGRATLGRLQSRRRLPSEQLIEREYPYGTG